MFSRTEDKTTIFLAWVENNIDDRHREIAKLGQDVRFLSFLSKHVMIIFDYFTVKHLKTWDPITYEANDKWLKYHADNRV